MFINFMRENPMTFLLRGTQTASFKKVKEKFGGFTFICLLCHCSLAKFHFGVDKQGINT